MCFRHKKIPYVTPVNPELITPDALRSQLRAASELDGVHRFECALDLASLPGQDEVYREVNTVPKVTKSKAKKNTQIEAAESMRVARARCRPLVNLIHEATGYSFMFVISLLPLSPFPNSSADMRRICCRIGQIQGLPVWS